jgi:hypothetical protein
MKYDAVIDVSCLKRTRDAQQRGFCDIWNEIKSRLDIVAI